MIEGLPGEPAMEARVRGGGEGRRAVLLCHPHPLYGGTMHSAVVVAQRSGISRTSLYKVETGHSGATLGTYLRVLAVLGLEGDINALAADDRVGRKLQDLALERAPSLPSRRRTSGKTGSEPSPATAVGAGEAS